MKTIYFIILSTLIATCGSVPFRHRRQINDLELVNNGIPLHVADQSAEIGSSLVGTDDSESLPPVNDHTEATQPPLIIQQQDRAVVINDQEELLPYNDEEDDNQVEQNVNGHNLHHEEAKNQVNSNYSDEVDSLSQDGSNFDSGFEHDETTHAQSLEHDIHNQRSISANTDGHHFLLGEVDTHVHPIINMTDENHEPTYTIGLPDESNENEENRVKSQLNENPNLNDTEIVGHEHENGGFTTELNPIMSGTGSEEVLNECGNIDGENIDCPQNTSHEQQGVNVGGLSSVFHSNERDTENNIGYNANNNGEIGDTNVPIDKGTHPREEHEGNEPFQPPRHTNNPRTTHISFVEPPIETPTTPPVTTPPTEETEENVSRSPSTTRATSSTTTREPYFSHENVPGGTEEREHFRGTGESPGEGISGIRPDIIRQGEVVYPEFTEIPNTITESQDKGKMNGKHDERVSNSIQSVSPSILNSQSIQTDIVPSPAIVLPSPLFATPFSVSDELEMSTGVFDYYYDTEIFESEMSSFFDMQTEELFPSSIFVHGYKETTSTTTFDVYSSYPLISQSYHVSVKVSPSSSVGFTSLPSLTSTSTSSTKQSEPLLPSFWQTEIKPTRASSFSTTPSRLSESSAELRIASSPIQATSKRGVEMSAYILSEIGTPTISASNIIPTTRVSEERSQSITSSFLEPTESTLISSKNVLSTPQWSSTNVRINSLVVPTPPSGTVINKKDEHMPNVTSPPLVTGKKPDPGKDKPEFSNRTTTLPPATTRVVTAPLTTNRLSNISTTHILTTPPSTYIIIQLRMGWYDFCSTKLMFIAQIREIIRIEKEIEVNMEQFKLTSEYCSDVGPNILTADDITIQMYIVDTQGKIDDGLTWVTSDLIVKGFKDSDYFKVMSVKYHPDNIEHRMPDQKSFDKKTAPDITSLVIVIASVGGVCCVVLIVLQILIHRRIKTKRKQKQFTANSTRSSIQSMDHVALGVIPKSRLGSGYWNPAMDDDWDELEPKRLSHVLNSSLLANFCMDTSGIFAEFQTIPFDGPYSPSVVYGEEDKNRFANVLPYKHSRVKLKKQDTKGADYINANYITGYKRAKHVYIATQSPLVNTVDDFWRMIWEQQTRAILMINPVTQHSKPKQSTCYWPDNFETDVRREYNDFTVTLKKRDVQQDYIECTLELMDIERNLKREIHHFWYTRWSDAAPPEPLSFVKFVLDTRPHYENSEAPVVVHCGPGTGRTCTFIGVDICMRMFEDKRRIDILRCVQKMRHERAGAVQSREQYLLIYQALNEYSVVLSSPSISTRSSVVTLHAML